MFLLKLEEIAKNHNKTTAQVMIRWQIDRGVIVIPKSVTDKRIKSNAEVFDFNLSKEEMEKIKQLNKNWRAVEPASFKAHPKYPF